MNKKSLCIGITALAAIVVTLQFFSIFYLVADIHRGQKVSIGVIDFIFIAYLTLFVATALKGFKEPDPIPD